jgi:hypothetical protein
MRSDKTVTRSVVSQEWFAIAVSFSPWRLVSSFFVQLRVQRIANRLIQCPQYYQVTSALTFTGILRTQKDARLFHLRCLTHHSQRCF